MSNLWSLNWNDFGKGLVMAVIGAVLGVLYAAWQNGIPGDWPSVKKTLVYAASTGVFAAITYLFKNLGTGSGGQILTNKSKEDVKDAPKA